MASVESRPNPLRRLNSPLPRRMTALPVDRRGYPVPRFVEWIDGEPDFRVMSRDHWTKCVNHNRCWICGEAMGKHKIFVVGPMCCVNRVTSEPPCHQECAEFAVRNCPFMVLPSAKRRVAGLPEDRTNDGLLLEHNPGVACLWTTMSYQVFPAGDKGYLFNIGPPERMVFYAHGRLATRAEVDAAIEIGMPILKGMALKEGTESMRDLLGRKFQFDRLIEEAMPS